MNDLIKREDAIKAVEEAFDMGECHCDRYGVRGAINAIPSADRPHVGYTGVDEDYLVSVQEVLNITAETGAFETQRRVRELARRDRPQGEWIVTEQDNGHKWTHKKCSECGKGIIEPLGVSGMNFCPNCGADMRKGTDDE